MDTEQEDFLASLDQALGVADEGGGGESGGEGWEGWEGGEDVLDAIARLDCDDEGGWGAPTFTPTERFVSWGAFATADYATVPLMILWLDMGDGNTAGVPGPRTDPSAHEPLPPSTPPLTTKASAVPSTPPPKARTKRVYKKRKAPVSAPKSEKGDKRVKRTSVCLI